MTFLFYGFEPVIAKSACLHAFIVSTLVTFVNFSAFEKLEGEKLVREFYLVA